MFHSRYRAGSSFDTFVINLLSTHIVIDGPATFLWKFENTFLLNECPYDLRNLELERLYIEIVGKLFFGSSVNHIDEINASNTTKSSSSAFTEMGQDTVIAIYVVVAVMESNSDGSSNECHVFGVHIDDQSINVIQDSI